MKTFNINGEKNSPRFTLLQFDGTSERHLSNFPDIISAFSPNEESNSNIDFYINGASTESQSVTSLKPGRGYCIRSVRQFTIETDGILNGFVPDILTLDCSDITKAWHIIKFPFNSSINLSDYPSIKKAQKVSLDSKTFDTYSPNDKLCAFTTLDPNITYLISVSETTNIMNPNKATYSISEPLSKQFASKIKSDNPRLRLSNAQPNIPWESPKINIWLDSKLPEAQQISTILNDDDANPLITALLPLFGGNLDVLKNKVQILPFTLDRVFNAVGYSNDNYSRFVNLVFCNDLESSYFFSETPNQPTVRYYEDVCALNSVNQTNVAGTIFFINSEDNTNSELSWKFLSSIKTDEGKFESPNNIKDLANFKISQVQANFTKEELTNVITEAIIGHGYKNLTPTVKTITKGNCFNSCSFNSKFFNPNEVITNTNSVANSIKVGFDVEEIGYLKPFIIATEQTTFVDVWLFDGRSYSFAVMGSNERWLVRRNNSTKQWTLVGYFGIGSMQGDNIGFALSDKTLMCWGTNPNNFCRWEYLLNPDFGSAVIEFNKG